MNDNTNSFFIELSTLFDPHGFEEAENKLSQSESSFNNYFKNMEENASAFADIFENSSAKASENSLNAFGNFFDITSKNFLDIDNLAKQVFSSVANNALSALGNLAINNLLGGIGGSSLFGGLLGSRRSGGAINKTGAYYLHEGEFVLPPEIVASIQNNPTPNTQNIGQESTINITLNSPITINGNQENALNAQELCEEIASAARRGVSWAVEQAKISYKIGKQYSNEVSL